MTVIQAMNSTSKFQTKNHKILKDLNLFDGCEKCTGVEKAAEPERIWSAVEAPRAKLTVSLVEFRQPVTQTA